MLQAELWQLEKKVSKLAPDFISDHFFTNKISPIFWGFVRERHICHFVTIITWYRIFLCKVMKVNEGLKRPVIMICMLNWSNKNHVKNHREWKEGWKPDLKMRLFLKGELLWDLFWETSDAVSVCVAKICMWMMIFKGLIVQWNFAITF